MSMSPATTKPSIHTTPIPQEIIEEIETFEDEVARLQSGDIMPTRIFTWGCIPCPRSILPKFHLISGMPVTPNLANISMPRRDWTRTTKNPRMEAGHPCVRSYPRPGCADRSCARPTSRASRPCHRRHRRRGAPVSSRPQNHR